MMRKSRLIIDVRDGVPKSLREWAKREGLEMAFLVEIDEATLKAEVSEYVVDADGHRLLNDNGTECAIRYRTTYVSSLP